MGEISRRDTFETTGVMFRSKILSPRQKFGNLTHFQEILRIFAAISIKFYWKIAQILLIVYPKLQENFLLFVDFPQISIFTHVICWVLYLVFLYRRCHEKISYVSNYAFFTLLHKWVDRGQMYRFEKLQ